MVLVSPVPVQKAEPKSKLQASGSPACRCGKEVPNGIRRFGDSRALGRRLPYLAYQFQSRSERPDVVQYEAEPPLSFYTPHAQFSLSYSQTPHQSVPGGAADMCRGCKVVKN
jgi:hypothetical protein